MKYNYRYIAKFTVEAETPLSVGSGEKGISTDRLVAKDANGLPYIPGTSLTGVLRNSLVSENFINEIFGSGGDKGTGSRLIISSACLIGEDGHTVIEGLKNIDLSDGFYSYFSRLPERDHVRMTDKGAADTTKHGKFDEQLVHKGTRFVFEIELIGDRNDEANWMKLLQAFASPVFRIGAGTRKGFGKFKIINESSKCKIFDLSLPDQLKAYLNKSSSLNESINNWDKLPLSDSNNTPGWTCYSLKIKPTNFFLFGAGFGDDDVDNKPKVERFFEWTSGTPHLFEKDFMLIPGTSIKGTIAHRVAYYYNKEKVVEIGNCNKVKLETNFNMEDAIKKVENSFNIEQVCFASDSKSWNALEEQISQLNIEDINEWSKFKNELDDEVRAKENNNQPVGENNDAVKALFGYAKNSDQSSEGLRGRVIINDLYLSYDTKNDKVFNHVKIDRFTNGTIDGALFQEKATQYKSEIPLDIWVEDTAFAGNEVIEKAFLQTLNDIKDGNLQLGGNSNKGHGVFTGTLKTN